VGWVWIKLAGGVLVFKGSLVGIHGPIRREAEASAAAFEAGGSPDAANIAALGSNLSGEMGVLWVMIVIAVLNIALAIWRPRLRRAQASEPVAQDAGNATHPTAS